MVKVNKSILIVIAIFFGHNVIGQNVTNVSGYQEGNTAIITYSLDKEADIFLRVSADGGVTFSEFLSSVSGHVGRNVAPGSNRIVWDILSDYDKLVGDNIVFKVVARPPSKAVVNKPVSYQDLDVKPSFSGGDTNKFSQWVNQKLVYPKIAAKNGVQGRVTLQFTIEKDGSLTNVTVLRGADPALDKEAVRVVSQSPKWKPGEIDGKAVAANITFPVIFQLR